MEEFQLIIYSEKFKTEDLSSIGEMIRSKKKECLESTVLCICNLTKAGISTDKIGSKLLKKSVIKVA